MGGLGFEEFSRAADRNKDAMGTMYDKAMDKMKSDPKRVKGNMMTMDGVRELIADLYKGS